MGKGKKNQNPFIFLELVIKSGDLDFILFLNLVNLGAFFFHEKGFAWVEIIFFRSKFGKKKYNGVM
jgi:hypothetical protein